MYSALTKVPLLALLVAASLQGSLAQRMRTADCSAVEDDTRAMGIRAAIVSDLAVCENLRNRLQCCTSDYLLERVEQTEQTLIDGVYAQLRRRRERIEVITERLADFVEGSLLERLFDRMNIGFERNRTSVFGTLLSELRERFEIRRDDGATAKRQSDRGNSRFSIGDFVNRVVDRVRDEAVMEFDKAANRSQCIRNLVNAAVDNTRKERVSGQIQKLRQAVSIHREIVRLFRNFEEDAGGFRPLRVCSLRLTELLYCGRCFERVPPLCFNLCGALAKGCYSPLFSGLRRTFQRVLDISRDVLRVARNTVQDLNTSMSIVDLNRETLAMRLAEQCNINIGDSSDSASDGGTSIRDRLGKRQSDGNDGAGGTSDEAGSSEDNALPDIPDDIQVDDLTGVFQYGAEGPLVCALSNNRTQRRNCWDGEGIRIQDIDAFEGDEIDEQDMNPAIMLDFEELVAQSQLLADSDPASALLSDPGFADLVPEGVALEGLGEGDGDGNGAATVTVSAVALLAMVLAAFSAFAY